MRKKKSEERRAESGELMAEAGGREQ